MDNKSDKIIRVERTIEKGEVVSEKLIVEPETPPEPKSKSLFGLNRKDQFDIAFKIVGLATILLAILQYTNQMSDKRIAEAEKAKQEYRDSIGSIAAKKVQMEKNLKEQYQLQTENQRKDYALDLERLKLSMTDQAGYRDFAQREDQFRQEYLRQIQLFNSQVAEGRVNEFAVRQYESFAKIATQISKMQTSVNARNLDASEEEVLKGQIFQSQLLEKDSMPILSNNVIETYRKARGMSNSISWFDSWYVTVKLIRSEISYYGNSIAAIPIESTERTLNRFADFCVRIEKETRGSYNGDYPMVFNAFFRNPRDSHELKKFDSLSKLQRHVITVCKNLIFEYHRIYISGQKQTGIPVDEYAKYIDYPSLLYARKQPITKQSVKDIDSSLYKTVDLMGLLKFDEDMTYLILKLDFYDAASELMNYMNRKKIFAGKYDAAGK